jgi:hypothetical protein
MASIYGNEAACSKHLEKKCKLNCTNRYLKSQNKCEKCIKNHTRDARIRQYCTPTNVGAFKKKHKIESARSGKKLSNAWNSLTRRSRGKEPVLETGTTDYVAPVFGKYVHPREKTVERTDAVTGAPLGREDGDSTLFHGKSNPTQGGTGLMGQQLAKRDFTTWDNMGGGRKRRKKNKTKRRRKKSKRTKRTKRTRRQRR